MAIASCHVDVISRGKGKSAVAAAAYRAGEKLQNTYEGTTYDYRRKQGVVYAEILTPAHVPQWAHDRAQLWNEVERVETRCNARTARQIEIALPRELTHEQQLSGKTDMDIDISNQCGRLVANAIIYFNSALLSLLLEKYQACNNKKAIEKLKKTSPAAWRNIHLTGQHPFYTDKHPIDLEEILANLEDYWKE